MPASDLSTVAYIFRRLYADGATGDLAMRDHPLFMDIGRQGGFVGSAFFYPVRYGNPQGVGGTFAATQTGAQTSKGVQLQAARRPKYGVILLDGEAMAAATDRGAFMDLVRMETDGVLEEMGDALAFDLYRDGSGQRGRRASISSNTITLTVVDDARNFKVGMTVIADNDANGASPRTGSTTVTAVDEDAGTVTVASAAAISGFVDNDYLFRAGDPGTCMEGLELCTPLTAPALGSDSFRGIDRGADPRRLAGIRVNDTSSTIEENLGLAAVRVAQIGKRQDRAYLNPINFWQVARRLNAKVEYDGGGGEAGYGFQFISIHTPAGVLKVVADPDCQINRGWGMRMEKHYLKHLKGLPHIINDDNNFNLRSVSADSIEGRARAWVNYVQIEPGCFSVIAI
jgi:hypothetical protein